MTQTQKVDLMLVLLENQLMITEHAYKTDEPYMGNMAIMDMMKVKAIKLELEWTGELSSRLQNSIWDYYRTPSARYGIRTSRHSKK